MRWGKRQQKATVLDQVACLVDEHEPGEPLLSRSVSSVDPSAGEGLPQGKAEVSRCLHCDELVAFHVPKDPAEERTRLESGYIPWLMKNEERDKQRIADLAASHRQSRRSHKKEWRSSGR